MKISVSVSLNYSYLVDIPEEIDGIAVDRDDILFLADCEDPVFDNLCKVLEKADVDFSTETNSIVNEETGEMVWWAE